MAPVSQGGPCVARRDRIEKARFSGAFPLPIRTTTQGRPHDFGVKFHHGLPGVRRPRRARLRQQTGDFPEVLQLQLHWGIPI
jgi:hypothetical protein